MKRNFFIVIMLFFSIITVRAQSNNVVIGVVPIGRMSIESGNDSNSFDFNYNPTYSASAGYEIAGRGLAKLFEVYYTRGTVEGVKVLSGDAPDAIPPYKNTGSAFGLAGHWGRIINNGHRFQVPLYFGVGLGYVDGPLNSAFEADLRAKARMKLYIVDKVGLFVGGHARYGMNPFNNDISIFTYGVEAGLVIALNHTYVN